METGVEMNVAQLFGVPVYRAADVDADGHVLVTTDESGSLQLAEIAPDGRMTTLTDLPGPCGGRYLPGRRAVLVTHDEDGNERTQISVLELDRTAAPEAGGAGTTQAGGTPAGLDDLEPLVRDPRYAHHLAGVTRERLLYVTNRRNGVDFDVIVRDLETGEETLGYDGGGNVGNAALAADGRWLAVTVPATLAQSDQLLIIDLAEPAGDDRITVVTGADEHALNEGLCWTPSGDALLVTSNRDRDLTGVARYEPAAGEWHWLVTDDDHDVTGWLAPDGSRLLVEANVDGASRLTLHDATTGAHLRDLTLPTPGCVQGNPLPAPTWSPDSRTVVASFSGATVPGDVLHLDVETGTVRSLTHSASHEYLHVDGVAKLVEPTSVRIPTPDGETVQCFVYATAGSADGPLAGAAVLHIHGGPEGQSKRMFNAIVAGLRLAGLTVLVPNVRGSVGYGKRWYSLDDVRLRLDSVADLAAIHDYLPKLGLAPDRAALWGGSYGGYMVLAGLAFQPERWAAGVDIVGMSSLVTFLENTSAYRRAIREREYGSLAHDRDFLHEASPMRKVDDIRAPLFVIHGANDPRVPVTEAEQLHAALTGGGVKCELLIFDDEGHGLAKRVNKLAAYPRAIDFLCRHLAAKS